MSLTALDLEPKYSYFVGCRHKKADYRLVDNDTGEVREGTSDKWRLFFIVPLDTTESNVSEMIGSSCTYFDVKHSDLSSVLGLPDKSDYNAALRSLSSSPVYLDIALTTSSNGTQTAKLRRVMSLADFIESMS